MRSARGVVLGVIAPSRALGDTAVALGNPCAALGRNLAALWALSRPRGYHYSLVGASVSRPYSPR